MAFFREDNYELHQAAEAREAARLAAIRATREARMDRLLDPRNRTMGLDAEGLAAQQRERELAKASERAAEAAAAQARKDAQEAVLALERKAEADRRARAAAAAAALEEQTAKRHERTTWDLNDPSQLRTSAPVRLGVDDPRLGPSSAQVFTGEDPTAAQRKLLQQAQVRAWVRHQADERAANKAAARAEDVSYGQAMARAAALGDELAAGATADMRARRLAAAAANEEAAARREQERARERQEERAAGVASMATLTTRGAGMALLAEDVADGVSAADPRRFRPDHYRGLPRDAALATADAYLRQMADKSARGAQEAADEKRVADEEAIALREAALKERAAAAARAEAARAQREALEQQRAAAEAKKAAEREARARSGIGPEFFGAFGKSF